MVPGIVPPMSEMVEYSIPSSVDFRWKALHQVKEAEALKALEERLCEWLDEGEGEGEGEDAEADATGPTGSPRGSAFVIDFSNCSSRSRDTAQFLRDEGLTCRTLFSNNQLSNSCGYNSAKWACMLRELGSERFLTLTREQASVVLQPAFIVQQNMRLGYGSTTEAEWLDAREILRLATYDNPEGQGESPWWVDVAAYDHFVAAFTRVMSHETDVRRGSLQIHVVNTDCASQGGTHWFVVAWLIE